MNTTKIGYIFTYVDPDTDGVCSSIAYANLMKVLKEGNFRPVVFGKMDNETKFVLNYFAMIPPLSVTNVEPDSTLVIVDTHHKNQIPSHIPLENVKEIIDHHPAGNPEIFPNAKIQNEKVGAAATLVAERFQKHSLTPSREISGILSAAIVSNTLNFNAPSTSLRDRKVFEWLGNFVKIDNNFINNMFKARSDLSKKSTKEIIMSDYKEFVLGEKKIGISQLETNKLENLLNRSNLNKTFKAFRESQKIDHFFLNGVDIPGCVSVVIAIESDTKLLLEKTLGANFIGNSAKFNRILLRKTDFIPKLEEALKK